MQAYVSSPSQSSKPSWYLNTGATHYITSDLVNLNVKAEESIE